MKIPAGEVSKEQFRIPPTVHSPPTSRHWNRNVFISNSSGFPATPPRNELERHEFEQMPPCQRSEPERTDSELSAEVASLMLPRPQVLGQEGSQPYCYGVLTPRIRDVILDIFDATPELNVHRGNSCPGCVLNTCHFFAKA